MKEKLNHMTIAEMKDMSDFMRSIDSIPERKAMVHHFGYCVDERDAMPGLHAKAEFSPETGGYDYLYAELMRNHDAEKSHVRNRRRADRKHKMTPKMRKEQEWMRSDHRYMMLPNWGTWDDISMAEYRVRNAEKTARADWETEKSQHADAMAEYYDYVDFTEDHWNKFECAWDAGCMSNAEYWRSRANETQKIADALYSGEEYYRRNKSFGVRADIYLRLYKEADKWLQWA